MSRDHRAAWCVSSYSLCCLSPRSWTGGTWSCRTCHYRNCPGCWGQRQTEACVCGTPCCRAVQHICNHDRCVRFGFKLSQIGSKCDKSGFFFRSVFSTFWLAEPKCSEISSEKALDLFHFGAISSTLGPNLFQIGFQHILVGLDKLY